MVCANTGNSLCQLVGCLLKYQKIAPLFTNAYVYMIMGRMVWNYIPDAKLYRITAWRFGTYFVVLDIV